MNPIALKHKYGLSYTQMSEWFDVDEFTVRRWAFKEEAKGRRSPSPTVCRLAKTIDFLLSMGVKIEDVILR